MTILIGKYPRGYWTLIVTFSFPGEILWEGNTCVGNAVDAMGSGIMTYSGGYATNIYMGSSKVP